MFLHYCKQKCWEIEELQAKHKSIDINKKFTTTIKHKHDEVKVVTEIEKLKIWKNYNCTTLPR